MAVMNRLTLTWVQAMALNHQIHAVREGKRFGTVGKLIMDDGCVVEWDKHEVTLEIPDQKEGSARPFPES